jgi:hypothetical protein
VSRMRTPLRRLAPLGVGLALLGATAGAAAAQPSATRPASPAAVERAHWIRDGLSVGKPTRAHWIRDGLSAGTSGKRAHWIRTGLPPTGSKR